MILEATQILSLEDVKKDVLEFCVEPHGRDEILDCIQVKVTNDNHRKFVVALVNQRFIKSDHIRNCNSAKQKYVITQKGLNYLKAIN